LGTSLKVEDYYDDAEMPGSRLKIGFHGDRGASEQILIIPFRDGEDVRYFVFRGVSKGDRRVTRCDMIRIMSWDQLIDYLGDVWEEVWDAMLFELRPLKRTCHKRHNTPHYISHFQRSPKEIDAGPFPPRHVRAMRGYRVLEMLSRY
jgi:hypothetical protein